MLLLRSDRADLFIGDVFWLRFLLWLILLDTSKFDFFSMLLYFYWVDCLDWSARSPNTMVGRLKSITLLALESVFIEIERFVSN